MRASAIAGSFIIARMAASTSSALLSPILTPPASLLCRMSGEITFSTNGGLSFPHAAAASPASFTTRDFGTFTPNSAKSRLPACSSRAARPLARASEMSCPVFMLVSLRSR